MASAGGPQWVKVGFYGRVRHGEVITGVDLREVSAQLMKAFGFTHIDDLAHHARRRQPRRLRPPVH